MSSLREHLLGLKALPAVLNKHSTGADVALLEEKQLTISQENILLCNNICPVCTHIQVAIKKVISTFSHEIAIVCLFIFVALRPKSTAMVIAGRSVHLTTLFPGQT